MKFIKYNTPKMVNKGSYINPNYDFVDVVDTDTQTDITDILSIGASGLKTGRDFLFVRAELLTLLTAAGGFASLTSDEKRVIIEYSLVTEVDALTIVSQSEYDAIVDNYLSQAKISRATRVELARKKFGQEIVKGTLPYADSNLFWDDSEVLMNAWVAAYNPAFIDWINSTGAYAGNGFAEKSYYTAARKAYLTDHIIDGVI